MLMCSLHLVCIYEYIYETFKSNTNCLPNLYVIYKLNEQQIKKTKRY